MKLIFTLAFVSFFVQGYSTPCNQSNSLISVKKKKIGNADYVIFTLKLPVTATNSMTSATPPFIQDGSGATITIAGCAYKKVTFNNIVWTCKTKIISHSTQFVQKVKNIGQFEGIISYVIGYKCTANSVVSYSYIAGSYQKFVVRFKH